MRLCICVLGALALALGDARGRSISFSGGDRPPFSTMLRTEERPPKMSQERLQPHSGATRRLMPQVLRSVAGDGPARFELNEQSSSKKGAFDWAANVATTARAGLWNKSVGARGDMTRQEEEGSAVCRAVGEALPFMSQELMRTPGPDGWSCIVPVKRSSCMSSHPLWDCTFRDDVAKGAGGCSCSWEPVCHGIAMVLKSLKGVPLVCGPDVPSGGCRCRGFDRCPSNETRGWLCSEDRFDITWGLHRVRAAAQKLHKTRATSASQNSSTHDKPENIESNLIDAGICSCSVSAPRLPLLMMDEERADYLSDPLDAQTSVNMNEAPKTAAGKAISAREVQMNRNGEHQVVLTVKSSKATLTTTMQPVTGWASHKAAAHQIITGDRAKMLLPQGAPSDNADEDEPTIVGDLERCVITGGSLSFSFAHWVVLGVVMVPLVAVIFIVGQIRWGTLSACASLGVSCVPWATPHPSPAANTLCGGAGTRPQMLRRFIPAPGDDLSTLGPYSTVLASDQASEHRLAPSVVVLLVCLVVLLKLNVSQLLTTSHLIVSAMDTRAAIHVANKSVEVDDVQGERRPDVMSALETFGSLLDAGRNEGLGGAVSGVLIGAEPFGGIIGVVFVSHCMLPIPRQTLVGACVLVFIGSALSIVALSGHSLPLLFMSRVLGGTAEGALFLGQTYLARLSSKERRTEVFGYWELGTAMGLLGGPTATSIVSTYFFPGNPGMAGACMMAALSCWLGTLLSVALPSNDDLGAAYFAARQRADWLPDEDMSSEKCVVALVNTTSTVVRLLMRLLWEASAVLVLAAHFCLGHVYSGYGATSVICMYLISQLIFVHLIRRLKLTDHGLIQICEFMELCGLLMMLRRPRDAQAIEREDVMDSGSSVMNILVFLTGSSLFYAGNCLTSAPLGSWSTKRGPREACVLFYSHIAIHGGVCLGACLARLFTGTDPHQNTLVILLLPMVLAQVGLSEIGLRVGRGEAPVKTSVGLSNDAFSAPSRGNKGHENGGDDSVGCTSAAQEERPSADDRDHTVGREGPCADMDSSRPG